MDVIKSSGISHKTVYKSRFHADTASVEPMNVRKNSTRSPITLAAYVTAIAAIAALLAARAPATAMEKQEKPVLARSAPCRGSWTASGEDSRARSSTVGNSMRSGESL